MSPRKLLLLTAVVLVLFGFIFLFERKMPSTSERKEKGDLVWDLPQDRIESVRLDRGGSVTEFKKGGAAGAGWRIVKPEAYPADAGAVDDMISQLARLRRASADQAEARPEDYGFKTPSAKATIVWKEKGDDKKLLTRTLELGIDIPGTDATAARVTGSENVFFVPSSVAAAVKKGPDDFKSKEVFTGATADIARIDVERGRGRLTLSKKTGAWWLVQPLADLAETDAVQRLLGDLTGLRALEFLPVGDRQSLASLGLSPPLYRVTLSDSKGASATVDLGATRSNGNSVYAGRGAQIFTVGSSITDELSKEAEAFREPRLVRFDRAGVTAVSGSFGGKSLTLEREASGWSSGGKALLAGAADDLLSAILDLKSRSFLDEPAGTIAKGREPETTVTVKMPGADWTIRIYPLPGQSRASVSGRPGSFALATDPTQELLSAFEKAATPLAPTPKAAPKKKP